MDTILYVPRKRLINMTDNMKKLQWVPFGTPEHSKVVRSIQEGIKSRDFILCMKGIFEPDRSPHNDKNTLAIKKHVVGLGSMSNAFEGDQNVFASDKYYFVRRDKAEYNLHHRQVNVGLLITDNDDNVLVLRKRNKYLSLVGGHTDFTRNAYTMTVQELCHFNMLKEFNEEVKSKKEIDIPDHPFLFVTEGLEMWDYFHCWFLYHVQVDDLKSYKFKSNEVDKHDTEIVKIKDILENHNEYKIKNSLYQAVKTLDDNRDALMRPRIKVRTPERV